MFRVLRYCIRYSNFKVNKIDVKYLTRAITGDRIKPLDENTLTGRFLIYLDNNRTNNERNSTDKKELRNALKHLSKDIRSCNASQVNSVLHSLNDREIVQTRKEFTHILNLIDNECCNRVNNFNLDETIHLLNAFVNAIPHQINACQYFHLGLNHLIAKHRELNKDQLIHLIFFIGLLKKSPYSQKILRQCLKCLDSKVIRSLTKEELCIICNSTFKTSTKIKNTLLLDKIKLYINDNLNLLTDPAVFVTLIKTLRHNRYQDDDIINTITCTMFFNRTIDHYSFSAMCHILAMYSDYLYFDENVLKVFLERCLQQLKGSPHQSRDTYLEEQPRTKDIKRFLWSLSNLNYNIGKEDIENIVVPQIFARIRSREFDRDPGSFVQMILYLWMMQYKAYGLIEECLTAEVVRYIRGNKLPCRDELNLLLTCIYHEDPALFQKLKIYPEKSFTYTFDRQLAKRPSLQKIVNNLKTIAKDNNIDRYEVCCQVPYVNIIGIAGFQKKIYKSVNIEVLDEYTCLKNSDSRPSGLMQLKLRILDKSDEGLVVLEEQDIAELTDSELKDILLDEVSLVC